MFRKLSRSSDGRKFPRVSFETFPDGWTIPKRHFILQLPLGYELELSVGFQVGLQRLKMLQNTDLVPYNEPIAADDWRDQPHRPSGLPW